MHHRVCPFGRLGLCLAAAFLLVAVPATRAQTLSTDQPDLVSTLLPTVVNITVFAVDRSPPDTASIDTPAAPPARPKPLQGSGIIIDPTGVILTNYHSVAGGSDMSVTLSDGTVLRGRILTTASRVDLALVKVDTAHPLVAAHWGDSEAVRVGEWVCVIGNPLGAGMSVTTGIVSALHRDIDETAYDDMIQTDAAINHGNSGGPLFNRRGEVVGVATAIISPTPASAGLGFAIPANDARYVAERLLREGKLRQGYIGIRGEQVTQDMAAALGMAQPVGSIVSLVRVGEPADAAGIRVGDVILRYNNQAVPDNRALLRDILRSVIGKPVPITVLRTGHEQVLQVNPADWPNPAATVSAEASSPHVLVPPDLGMSLSTLTADMRARHGLQTERGGVMIDGVTPGVDAFDRGLQAGDVILRMQDAEVASPQEVQAAIEAARSAHNTFVMALVLSPKDQLTGPRWLALKVSEAP